MRHDLLAARAARKPVGERRRLAEVAAQRRRRARAGRRRRAAAIDRGRCRRASRRRRTGSPTAARARRAPRPARGAARAGSRPRCRPAPPTGRCGRRASAANVRGGAYDAQARAPRRRRAPTRLGREAPGDRRRRREAEIGARCATRRRACAADRRAAAARSAASAFTPSALLEDRDRLQHLDLRAAADVVHALRRAALPRAQVRLDRVVDEREVARLLAVAVHR